MRSGTFCPEGAAGTIANLTSAPIDSSTVEPCPSCFGDNPEGARFCSTCGTRLVEPSSRAVRKIVTLLFTDVSGSTAMGEGRDPETIRTVMDRYFASMRAVIERHGGTVEKFVGDAVMAVFGIPVVREDDALRAVRAAVEMQERLAELNDDLDSVGAPPRDPDRRQHRGGDRRRHVTVSRSLPVTRSIAAARLEQAAGAGEILLGESTYRLVRDAVEAERLRRSSLKGKAEPVPAYRLIAGRAGAGLTYPCVARRY